MPKFPIDAPKDKVIKAMERLGFGLGREGSHITMRRENGDGTSTPLTLHTTEGPINIVVHHELSGVSETWFR